ncbi:MAG: hypothetical protein Q9182_001359 [Xanthomendoza sp. 2 TL-2023]
MHFTKFLALVGFFATAAIAAPNAEPNNPKPTKPTPSPSPPAQQNVCGNGAQPYCCNTDSKGAYTSCYAFQFSSQCSQTTVCCNAQNSVQTCIGNARITTSQY